MSAASRRKLQRLSCQRCGAPWPEFFNVPDDVWQHYVLSLGDGNPILCVDCFNFIAELTDGGEYARKHGGAIMLNDMSAARTPEARARWQSLFGPSDKAPWMLIK